MRGEERGAGLRKTPAGKGGHRANAKYRF